MKHLLLNLSHRLPLSLRDWRPWTLLFFLQTPSLRAIFKYLPHPFLAAFVLGFIMFAIYSAMFSKKIPAKWLKLLDSYIVTALLLALCLVATYLIYPVADALKFKGLGSTADDGLIEPIKQLLAGGALYSARLYDGAPISAGPGWLLFNMPFTATGLYYLLTPVYLGIMIVMIARMYGQKIQANLFLIALYTSLSFWELTVTGHDMVALACNFIILAILADRYSHSPRAAILIGLLSGLVATSRIVFLVLPPFLGFLVTRRNKQGGIIIGILGLLTAVTLHAGFYLSSNEWYQPLHLFSRADRNMGAGFIGVGLIASTIFGIAAIKYARNTFESLVSWLGLNMAVPLAFISLAELNSSGWNFARWEGANYLFLAAPMIVYATFLSSPRTREAAHNNC